jgi:hypothetical protein
MAGKNAACFEIGRRLAWMECDITEADTHLAAGRRDLAVDKLLDAHGSLRKANAAAPSKALEDLERSLVGLTAAISEKKARITRQVVNQMRGLRRQVESTVQRGRNACRGG